MHEDVYKKLAIQMDSLPGGFPVTPDGVEIRILKLLFTQEEASLALHLNLIAENAKTVAYRSGLSIEKASVMLEEMAFKGIVFRSIDGSGHPKYMAAQYIVGIWELQVNRLTPELVKEMDVYIPHLINAGVWKKAPQMRVIPINRSLDQNMKIMTYEDAEKLIRTKSRFVLAPCICRLEMSIHGKSCSKPIETCISFGGPGDYYRWTGSGREASLEEVLTVLETADRAGLVLQPSNDREVSWICCCCGCCCGLLRNLKKFPNPGEISATPFYAVLDKERCTGCGLCVKRCQMDALTKNENGMALSRKKCIGCGLCVTTCPFGAIRLVRKPASAQPVVPPNLAASMLRVAWKRGKISFPGLAAMILCSFKDRFLAILRFM